MTAILGISAFYHDSAAALVVDGVIVAAAQEERFTRIKHDHQFPKQAVDYCLAVAGLTPEQVDHVVFYEKPLLKFERLLETYLAVAPAGFRSFLQAATRGPTCSPSTTSPTPPAPSSPRPSPRRPSWCSTASASGRPAPMARAPVTGSR